MKRLISLLSFVLSSSMLISSCNSSNAGGTNFQLNAPEFSEKIASTPGGVVLDVRTPGEFAQGHIANATNISWNDPTFDGKINNIPKTTPIFIYNGYTNVYELMGGLMKWSAANLPLTTDSSVKKAAGMDLASFKELTKGDKIVLVDFYADWCLPCKKMEPFLNEIANEKKDKVTLIRINADEQSELCKILKIDALPYLQLYKSEDLLWEKVGFIDKKGIEKEIDLIKF